MVRKKGGELPGYRAALLFGFIEAAALADALAAVRETWESETTARNLRLIREARERRGETVAWAKGIEDSLTA